MGKDVDRQLVEVPRRVDVVEPLAEAVHEHARVRLPDLDVRVRPLGPVEREEGVVDLLLRNNNRGLRPVSPSTRRRDDRVPRRAEDFHLAQEAAGALGLPEHERREGRRHGEVDAVLDVGEDGQQHAGEEDDHLERGHAPEVVHLPRRREEVADGVDDDGRQARRGDEEEDRGEGVQGQQHDDRREDAGEGRPYARLGLDGCAGEGSGRGVSAEKRAEDVGEADGDELLRWVDDVVVYPAKRLGDGDVLDDQHDDGDGDIRRDGSQYVHVHIRRSLVPEPAWHRAEDLELGFLGVLDVSVGAPADEDVHDDHEGHAQRGDEEPHLLPLRLLSAHEVAERAEEIQEEEGAQSHGGVELGAREALERVDDNQVGRVAGIDTSDTHHRRHLSDADAERRTGHERGDGDQRDELDDEAGPDQAEEEQHAA